MNYGITRAADKGLRVIYIQMRPQSVQMGSQKETEKNRGFTMLIKISSSSFFLGGSDVWRKMNQLRITKK